MLAFNCEWKRQSRREYTALDHPSGYDPEIMLVSILSKTDYGIYLKSKNVWSFLINVHTFTPLKNNPGLLTNLWEMCQGTTPESTDQVSQSIVLENYLSFIIWSTNVCLHLSPKITHTFLACSKMSVTIGQNWKPHGLLVIYITTYKRHPGLFCHYISLNLYLILFKYSVCKKYIITCNIWQCYMCHCGHFLHLFKIENGDLHFLCWLRLVL